MKIFKRRFWHFTWRRFAAVLGAVAVFSAVMYRFTPGKDMPAWVYRLHVPLWFAHYWALWVPVVSFLALTWVAYAQDWMKLPPLPHAKQFPHRPDLSTKELDQLMDRERERRTYIRSRSRAEEARE